jgi:hypothetical protein
MPALLLSLHNTSRVKTAQQIEVNTRAANTTSFDHRYPFTVTSFGGKDDFLNAQAMSMRFSHITSLPAWGHRMIQSCWNLSVGA